ncbi:MAG: hypothetical protein V1644_01950 [Candidatus Micrarchaeota archaeon]
MAGVTNRELHKFLKSTPGKELLGFHNLRLTISPRRKKIERDYPFDFSLHEKGLGGVGRPLGAISAFERTSDFPAYLALKHFEHKGPIHNQTGTELKPEIQTAKLTRFAEAVTRHFKQTPTDTKKELFKGVRHLKARRPIPFFDLHA